MNLKSIIEHAVAQERLAALNERLVDIYTGNLIEYVKESLSKELSAASYAVASKRIPSINLVEKITDKLSKVYSEAPNRSCVDERDSQALELYSQSIDINAVMANAEVLLNLNKCFALEPYVDNGVFKVRVLAPYDFTVYSDDIINPNKPTALVKFMGAMQIGKKVVNRYWIYTNTTFVDCTSDGEVLEQRDNPYQVIPFIYCTQDNFKLQPKPDTDTFENALLVPKLLADLNFAVQYQSRSITYTVDLEVPKDITNSPDVLWSLKSSSDNINAKPSIGIISPTVDTEKVLALITYTVSSWLDSKGIKPGSGNLTNTDPSSAVSKLVDEADASSLVNANRILLTKAEQNLWKLIGLMHNTQIDQLDLKFGLSEPFQVSISFPIQKIIPSPEEQRNELKFKLENKLISYDRALRLVNPDLNDAEIEKLKAEIQSENANG